MFLLGTTFYAEGNGGFSQNLETPRHWQEQSAYYNTLHECELRGGSFDSTNMYYVGNWPFSKTYCVDIDIARQLIFVSSGGGVNIVDVSDPTNPIILDGYKIRTRGNIAGQQAIGWGAQYLTGGLSYESNRLYIATWFNNGDALEIWDVAEPKEPFRLGTWHPEEPVDIEPRAVDVQGDYAYIAAGYHGLRVVDVSDPANPTEVGFCQPLPEEESFAMSFLKVQGDYVYATVSGYDAIGFWVFDVSDPTNPTDVGFVHWGYLKALDVAGAYAYVGEDTGGSGWMRVYDISDPTNPTMITKIWAGNVKGVAVYGDYAYVTGTYGTPSDALRIFDISDPTNPLYVSAVDTDKMPMGVVTDGSCAYVAATSKGLLAIDVTTPSTPAIVGRSTVPYVSRGGKLVGSLFYWTCYNNLWIFDVSDPSYPVLLGWVAAPSALKVDVQGNYAYVAEKWEGMGIYDVSNPSSPVEVGRYVDDDSEDFDVAVQDNYAYLARREWGGMAIIDISNPTNPTLEGKWRIGGPNNDDSRYLEVYGSYVYNCSWWDSTLYVIDVSNPGHPVTAGSITFNGGRRPQGMDIDTDFALRPYIYVALFKASGGTGFAVIDVSNPETPTMVSSLSFGWAAQSVGVFGNLAFLGESVGYLGQGNYGTFWSIDISDPLNPYKLGYHGVPSCAMDVVAGVFGTDTLAIASARITGLQIYGCIPTEDITPPARPYIYGEKSIDTDVCISWHPVTTDTLGGPEIVDRYIVYRNTDPSFVPTNADSIGFTSAPDTVYTDVGVLPNANSYYYLVKAVDVANNRGRKSNMGYKFNKSVNENPSATDKNWVSLSWHSEYSMVSDLTTDLSPLGDPLIKIANLRDDQNYESWLWDPVFLEWYGTDFAIQSGRGYEMVIINDTILVLVGSNNPDGLVTLNENPDATDKNWVSIPYNAVYSTVSHITTHYSPIGDPLIKLTNLRDDQLYENWIWDPDFYEWYGTDFVVTPGRGYEFVTIVDAFWNPLEYSNEAKAKLAAKKVKDSGLQIYCGKSTEPDRTPVWLVEDGASKLVDDIIFNKKTTFKEADVDELVTKKSELTIDYSDADIYKQVMKYVAKTLDYREAGISHVVRCHLEMKEFDNLVFTLSDNKQPTRFTAYRPDNPYDVLTENMVGCGIVIKDSRAAIWFNTGNFKNPWQDKEKVILIIEAMKKGKGYFAVVDFLLDNGIDIQDLGEITLIPIPEPTFEQSSVCWDGIDNGNIVGYSIYQGDKRLNEKVISRNEYLVQGDVILKPVIKGGYETVYSSQGASYNHKPISYAFAVYPNPFVKKTCVDYALPHSTKVNIKVYDVSGRQVKTLVSDKLEPGYYKINWFGGDNISRKVPAGVYFILMNTKEFESQHKVIFVH
jgi:hypothetical protein